MRRALSYLKQAGHRPRRPAAVRIPRSAQAPCAPLFLSLIHISLNVGESAQLTATVTPDNATDKSVKWSSSATEIVSTDQSGKLTALKAGEATVTVATTDGGKTASCAVTVNSPAKPQPKQPDVDNSVEISKDIDISETPVVYHSVEDAVKEDVYKRQG